MGKGTRKFKVGDFVEITEPGAMGYGQRARVVGFEASGVVVDPTGTNYGPYWGNAFGTKYLKRVSSLGPAKDEGVPEDEMVLAQLIQNASARGLKGCKYARFKGEAGDIEYKPLPWDQVGTRETPPPGTTQCCALGAQELSPPVSKPITLCAGNDMDEDQRMFGTAKDMRSLNIGAAFEQAMRPG